jgi:uncharacterized protein with HEPN domain
LTRSPVDRSRATSVSRTESTRRTSASDPVVQAAAQRWIEILGEAASRVSDETKHAHPEIAWRDIVGTRVILAHAYFDIDLDIVGRVITDDVPRLRQQPHAVLAGLDGDD